MTPSTPTHLPVHTDPGAGLRYIEETTGIVPGIDLEWDAEAIQGDGGGLRILGANLHNSGDVDTLIAWLQQMRPVVEQIADVVGER